MRIKQFFTFGIALFLVLAGPSKGLLEAQTQRAAGLLPFSRGVVLSLWLESPDVQLIESSLYSENDFATAKRIGIDVIRLPIDLIAMSSGSSNYTIPPLLFKYIDQAVDWAEKYGLYIILDCQRLDKTPTPDDIDSALIPIWTQMAEHFTGRGRYLIYEILSAPNGIAAEKWGKIQGDVISVIRKADKRHMIVVGGVNSSIDGLSSLPTYFDNLLIYSFQFYDPFLFTNQTGFSLRTVPWPYDKNRMPQRPANISQPGRKLYDDYETESTAEVLAAKLDKVVAFSKERNAPVFCGEFGAVWNSGSEDRVRWHNFISHAMTERNIAWAANEYAGGDFNIMFTTPIGPRDLNTDLNVELLRALGFVPPVQSRRTLNTLRSSFTFYDDYFSQDFYVGLNYRGGGGSKASYRSTTTAEGEFAIRWENAAKDQVLPIFFRRVTDLSQFIGQAANLEFKAKTEKPVRLNIRFVNPETADAPPWRMSFTLDSKTLPADGEWHSISITLYNMQDIGGRFSSTGQWVAGRGAFSWNQVAALEIETTDDTLKDNYILFDSIRIAIP